MIHQRSFADRVHDRLWTELTGRLMVANPPLDASDNNAMNSSVSGSHPWVGVCREYASGNISSENFRRFRAVREIVETMGPVDARFYQDLIRSWNASTLADPAFERIDSWGDPIRWPGFLLGTPSKRSPTSLRYLAHAMWLKREGLLTEGGTVVEIGVGFGGLAAINAWISNASTLLVDLPDVVAAAERMLAETGFPDSVAEASLPEDHCIISNYAFTELTSDLQEYYFERYLRDSPKGVIISNAGVFAPSVGGHSDEDLIAWFRSEGLDATLSDHAEILCPSDRFHGVKVIRWDRSSSDRPNPQQK